MRPLLEFDVVQNAALGALALHAAVLQCYETSERRRGCPLALLCIVLPCVFHEQTREAIVGKNFNGSLYKSLAEHRAMPAGLQRRMEDMFDLTLSALNVASASGLIRRDDDPAPFTYVPDRNSAIPGPIAPDVRDITAAAKRIGYWAATTRFETLCSLLGVTF